MKAYREYRPTRLTWVGEVPKHWDEKRARFLFRAIDERSADGQEELLSVSHITGVTPRSEKNITMFMAESYEGHKLCCPGDVVINSLWAWMAALGVSKHRGIVSSAYHVYRQADDRNFNPAYMDFLLRLKGYAGEYLCRSKGVWTSRLLLTPSDFFDIPILLPPRPEQDAIVAFLEAKQQDMAAFIANKRRMIELLKEHFSAKIESLLNRGENSHRVRLGYYVELLPGFAFDSERFTTKDGDIRLLRGINVAPGQTRWDETVRYPSSETGNYSEYALQPGDLVLGMDRPWINDGIRVAEIRQSDTPCLLLQRVARLRARRGLRKSYLKLLLCSRAFQIYFEPILTGISVPHISPGQILSFRFPLPTVGEQDRVVKEIETERKEMSSAIAAAEREIELMEEYRTALIAAAVTGKIDVRKETHAN